MSASDSSEPESAGSRSKALWVGAVVLAAAATAVLVISDDARLLRLGLVAALWAALIGAFSVARLRNRVSESDEQASEQQRIYELELEREVSARREFELEAENEARRRVAEESESEVQALRAELRNLRESLEQMLGGDMLFERVALRAESTRVRSLTESGGQGSRNQSRVVEPQGRALPSGGGADGVDANAEQNTEMMTRISGDQTPPEPNKRPPQQSPKRQQSPKPQQPRQPQEMRPPQEHRGQAGSAQEHAQPARTGWPAASSRQPQPPQKPRYEPTRQSATREHSGAWPSVQDQTPQDQTPQGQTPQGQTGAVRAADGGFPGADQPSRRAGASPETGASGQTGADSWFRTDPESFSQQGESEEQPHRHESSSQDPSGSSQPNPGAHTQGTSVIDLLAAYGNSENSESSGNSGDSGGRRRRRS